MHRAKGTRSQRLSCSERRHSAISRRQAGLSPVTDSEMVEFLGGDKLASAGSQPSKEHVKNLAENITGPLALVDIEVHSPEFWHSPLARITLSINKLDLKKGALQFVAESDGIAVDVTARWSTRTLFMAVFLVLVLLLAIFRPSFEDKRLISLGSAVLVFGLGVLWTKLTTPVLAELMPAFDAFAAYPTLAPDILSGPLARHFVDCRTGHPCVHR